MKAIFFDACPSEEKIEKDEKTFFIALTPLAADRLKSRGLDYFIPEDFCSLAQQVTNSDSFYVLFKEWTNYLNKRIKEELSSKVHKQYNPILPIAYDMHNIVGPWYNHLFILDEVFKRLVEKGVTAIEWVGSPQKPVLPGQVEGQGAEWVGESMYSFFCEDLASKYGLQFQWKIVKPVVNTECSKKIAIVDFIKRITINKIINRLKLKWTIMRAALKSFFQNNKVVYITSDEIYGYLGFLLNNKFTIRKMKMSTKSNETFTIQRDIIQDSLRMFQEFNRVPPHSCIVDSLVGLIGSRIQDMIHIVNSLEKQDIASKSILASLHFTNLPFNYVNEYFRVNGIPRATISHGDGLYLCDYLDIADMQYSDMYLVSNSLYSSILNDTYKGLKCLETDLRYSSLVPIKKRHRTRSSEARKKILYLPTIYRGADTRFFKVAGDYPPVWYYQVQRTIIDCLLDLGYHVIYKAFPGDTATNPFLDHEKSHPNLEICVKGFTETFGTFDMMLNDFPSTGMFECIYSGIPCASIYPKELSMAKNADYLIGKVLFVFEDMKEIPSLIGRIMERSDQELLEAVKDVFPGKEATEKNRKAIVHYFDSLLMQDVGTVK